MKVEEQIVGEDFVDMEVSIEGLLILLDNITGSVQLDYYFSGYLIVLFYL